MKHYNINCSHHHTPPHTIYTITPHSYLHSNGEVVLCLGREEDVDCLLAEGLVARWRRAHFDHVQLKVNSRIESLNI